MSKSVKVSVDPFDAAVGVFWTLAGLKLTQHGLAGLKKSVRKAKVK